MSKAQELYEDLDRRILEEHVKPLVTPEIVEEHRRNPIGFHSDRLERVLHYLRRHHGTQRGKKVLVCTEPHKEWRIGELTGVRGEPPRVDETQVFRSREEAEHGIFLARLKDLGLFEAAEGEKA